VVVTTDAAFRNQHKHWPAFLPDGRHFIYFGGSDKQHTGIYMASLDSKDVRLLIPAESAGIFASRPLGASGQDHILYIRQGALVAQPFDSRALNLMGEPVSLADQVGIDTFTNASRFSASSGGVLAYGRGNGDSLLYWFDRSGKQLNSVGPAGALVDFRISPDNTRAAAQIQDNWAVPISGFWISCAARLPASPFSPRIKPDRCGRRTGAGWHSFRRGTVRGVFIQRLPMAAEMNSWR
jgi:hypothetical protein